jgi:hypothetical protein
MISAFASPNDHHGILCSLTMDVGSVKIPTSSVDLFVQPVLEDALCVIKPETESSVRTTIAVHPLNERAWTLHERISAFRIIHYTSQQTV